VLGVRIHSFSRTHSLTLNYSPNGSLTRSRRLHDKFHRELCLGVDPDKAVAMGAAIQAAILIGSDQEVLKDMLTMDVIPRSVGIETAGGAYEVR
jgi:molecular chaperone DnaK (HSP70)